MAIRALFFSGAATPKTYTLSLHDALPISLVRHGEGRGAVQGPAPRVAPAVHQDGGLRRRGRALPAQGRSEEHTSELQSQSNLVCRLLLEKKNRTNIYTSK